MPNSEGMYTVLRTFFNSFSDQDLILACLDSDDLINLMKLALSNDFVLFQGKTYCQIDGLSMGNPLAPQVAIIYMDSVEREIIISRINQSIYWKRYIDGIFIATTTDVPVEDILDIANNVSSCIQFTLERPNENGFLPFLDCEICLSDKGKLQSRLFFKPIHSGTISHWTSNGPISSKKALVLGEFRRATSDDNTKYSVNLVLSRFPQNGYP